MRYEPNPPQARRSPCAHARCISGHPSRARAPRALHSLSHPEPFPASPTGGPTAGVHPSSAARLGVLRRDIVPRAWRCADLASAQTVRGHRGLTLGHHYWVLSW